MKTVNIIALVIAIIGVLNWLLVGLFGFDLVAAIFASGFGTLSLAARIVYVIVGLSGIWLLFTVLPLLSTTPAWRQAPESAF